MVSKSEQKRIDALKGDDTAPIALLLKRLRGQRVDSETADPEGLMLVAADEIERLARVNQLSIQGSRWQHIDDARELAALRARVDLLRADRDLWMQRCIAMGWPTPEHAAAARERAERESARASGNKSGERNG